MGSHIAHKEIISCLFPCRAIDSDHTEFRWFTAEEIREIGNLDTYVRELIERKIILG